MALQNVGILPQHYMASQPRKPQLESSVPWKAQTLYLHTKCHVPKFSGSLVITIKLETIYKLHAATMLFSLHTLTCVHQLHNMWISSQLL